MASRRDVQNALNNRLELVRAGFTRRDLMRMGLMTGAGYLIHKSGLSSPAYASCRLGTSPPITPFLDPMPIPPILPERTLADVGLQPAPSQCPNNAINPATGLPFEGRGQFNGVLRPGTDCFQFFNQYPPQHYFIERMRANPNFRITSDTRIPAQTIWGFNQGSSDPSDVGIFPGPTIVTHYQQPCVIRRFNESMSTLWYHDHRVDHTAENIYKGLAGFLLLFNQFDTGDEGTGFRLPSFPQFDIPILLADKLLDSTTGLICFDTFENDGLVGDVQLANGKVQPFFNVNQRRYRFRVLDGGPSRFYEMFLTNPNNLSQQIPFWVIANDGNLLPKPVQVTSFRLGVAERYDIIIDFKHIAQQFGATVLNFENRLQQDNGRGPNDVIVAAGQGTTCVQFRLGAVIADNSVDPATGPSFYQLPSTNVAPRVRRSVTFDDSGGGWVINDRFMDCNTIRFTVQRNTSRHWRLQNDAADC